MQPRPGLDLLRTFLAVYRAGGLTRAARDLGVSQPAVTGQVRALETAVGRPLFERTSRGVVPTSAADSLATEVADHVDALERVVAARTTGSAGPLSRIVQLGGPPELTSARVLPSLADLVRQGLRIQVTLGPAETLLEGLANGRQDIVISSRYTRDRRLQVTALCDEDLVLVGAAVWAERLVPERFAQRGAAALQDVPVVTGTGDDSLLHQYCSLAFGELPQLRPVVTVDDLHGVISTLLAGAGVGVVPRYLVAGQLADGSLYELHRPEIPPINTLFLVVRAGALTRPHLAEVHTRLLLQARLW
jgi:DNA-binding transcriptional LysR family regulator